MSPLAVLSQSSPRLRVHSATLILRAHFRHEAIPSSARKQVVCRLFEHGEQYDQSARQRQEASNPWWSARVSLHPSTLPPHILLRLCRKHYLQLFFILIFPHHNILFDSTRHLQQPPLQQFFPVLLETVLLCHELTLPCRTCFFLLACFFLLKCTKDGVCSSFTADSDSSGSISCTASRHCRSRCKGGGAHHVLGSRSKRNGCHAGAGSRS